jgi:hypothetical protein
MKKEYYNDLFGGKKYGDYMVYGLDKSESKYSDYSDYTDLLNQMGSYYNATTFQEESEEQKAIREAKEKAQKRNNTIDKLLGE